MSADRRIAGEARLVLDIHDRRKENALSHKVAKP